MKDFQEYEIFSRMKKSINYFKGEVLPFVHLCCRKDMTSGDIDGFVWDFKRKIYRVFEQKWATENQKKSQHMHLAFLAEVLAIARASERFAGWEMGVYKIIGDPPFIKSTVEQISVRDRHVFSKKKVATRVELMEFMNMSITFDQIKG